MESFSAEWLALREPADHIARSADLTASLASRLERSPATRALDLAAGAGSNVRYLMPRVPHVRHWTLVDHDAALLAQAWRLLTPVAGTAQRSFDVRSADLAALDHVSFDGCALVTAAALLDLVSEAWLTTLARRCREHAVSALFALTYDGRIECEPADSDDALVRALVNRHHHRAKGFGMALGPDAARVAEACFRAEGFRVDTAPSDWSLTPEAKALQHQLVDGWAEAARDVAPDDAALIDAWRDQRVAHIDEGRSSMRVGHVDLAAWLA